MGEIDHDFDLIYDVPSLCADRLHRNETDVALIPAAEIGRGAEEYRIVPKVGIVSNGSVRSVFVVLGKEPEEIQRLALDSGSRTSAVLAQVVLLVYYLGFFGTFQISDDASKMSSREKGEPRCP